MSLTHRPIAPDQMELVAGVEVAPEQLKFSGSVEEAFEAAEEDVDFHGLFLDDVPVGFYKIDHRYQRTLPDPVAPGTARMGLRAFMIDRRQQGQGIATRAVLGMRDYLKPLYPGYDALWLTVNLANPAAIRCYAKGGFADTGDLHYGGSAGPQHIMRLSFE
ncbi:MAG: GNAT family N-acetyltransferase [Paracoccaceae bacterium]